MQDEKNAYVEVTTKCFDISGVSFVNLSVKDQGPGFPNELLERLFEPYVTTKAKGSGLGLAIVKKIVEEHGGTIQAENDSTKGARIQIRLPVSAMLETRMHANIQGDAA